MDQPRVLAAWFGPPDARAQVLTHELWVGSLDDPSTFKPEMLVYGSSGPPWDHVDPAISRK